MHIAFFETSPSDQVYLKNLLPQHKLSFSEETLSESSLDLAKDAEIISVFIYSKITADLLEKLPHLRAVTTRSTGFDHIDLEACTERGILVQNVPHYGENTVAEHTFALILALSRNVHKSYARGLKGDFSSADLLGFDLKDKTLGIIGTGRIGLHVIRMAKGFGMHVLAYDTRQDSFLSEILHFQYASLDTVLGESDILSLHIPSNENTKDFINRSTVEKIKRGALLINTSRGGIVDNEALLYGLEKGILSGAGLDVLEGEEMLKDEKNYVNEPRHREELKQIAIRHNILNHEKIVFTPHIAFYSQEALRRILDTTKENIFSFEENAPTNVVFSSLSV